MNETEWLNETDMRKLCCFITGFEPRTNSAAVVRLVAPPFQLSRRKCLLIGCACCRHVWSHLTDKRSRAAVKAAEQFVEGKLNAAQLLGASSQATDALHINTNIPWMAVWASDTTDDQLWALAEEMNYLDVLEVLPEDVQVGILRDVVGNPFRSYEIRWDNMSGYELDTVKRMARTAYNRRDWGQLPVLADVLEDTMQNPELSDHLRGPGPHVRGCWVLDLLLEKE